MISETLSCCSHSPRLESPGGGSAHSCSHHAGPLRPCSPQGLCPWLWGIAGNRPPKGCPWLSGAGTGGTVPLGSLLTLSRGLCAQPPDHRYPRQPAEMSAEPLRSQREPSEPAVGNSPQPARREVFLGSVLKTLKPPCSFVWSRCRPDMSLKWAVIVVASTRHLSAERAPCCAASTERLSWQGKVRMDFSK